MTPSVQPAARKRTHALRFFIAFLPLSLALCALFLAPHAPAWLEAWYTSTLYPPLASVWSRVFGWPHISFALCLAVLGVAAMLLFFVRAVVRGWRMQSGGPLFRFAYRLFAGFGALFAFFVFGWALQYARVPLEQTLAYDASPVTREELLALCDMLTEQANALRETIDIPDTLDAQRLSALLARVPQVYESARAAYPLLLPAGAWSAPKSLGSAGTLFTRLLIEGIYIPFTGEAHVNPQIPAVSVPFAACHEAAHQRGFAREDEANCIAYLVCMASDDPTFQYSATMAALQYTLNAVRDLPGVDYNAQWARLSPAVREGFRASNAFWVPYRAQPAAEVTQQVNNVYLQTIGNEPDGARSYGHMIRLLIGMQRSQAHVSEETP